MMRGDALGMVVTIVDDDASVRRALRRLVEGAGFTVDTFASGRQVLEFGLASGTASLVMDVHLGDMTGFDVHRALVAAGSRIPVIFITAHDDARTEERARQAGAAAYLRKPIRGAVLLRTIREAIAADRVT